MRGYRTLREGRFKMRSPVTLLEPRHSIPHGIPRVAAAVLSLLALPWLLAVPAQARDAASFGGNGGGEFRSKCPAGLAMFAYIGRAGTALDRIQPICIEVRADKGLGPRQDQGTDHGGNGGGVIQRTCPDSVVTSIRVFSGGDNLVSLIDLGCTNLKTGAQTAVSGRSAGKHTSNNLSTCNSDEIAVGIHGRHGAMIDRLGLICEKRSAVIPQPTPTPEPPPTPKKSELGDAILKYALDALGKCVDMTEKVRGEPCPPLKKDDTGHGECTHLAYGAIHKAGGYIPPDQYVWSTHKILEYDLDRKDPKINFKDPKLDIQPGDIIQVFKFELRKDDDNFWQAGKQHTAIVEKLDRGVLHVLEQNTWQGDTNRRYVTRGTMDLTWEIKSGKLVIYRAAKEKKTLVATSTPGTNTQGAGRTSGYRSIASPTGKLCNGYADSMWTQLSAARQKKCHFASQTGWNATRTEWLDACLKSSSAPDAAKRDQAALTDLMNRCNANNEKLDAIVTTATDLYDTPGGKGKKIGMLQTGARTIRSDCLTGGSNQGWAKVPKGYIWGAHINPGCK
jgi:hypothetical protein